MKDKKKKVPKNTDEDYIVSSSAEAVLYGVLFSLIGIIGLLNKGIVGSFITYCIVYLFGAFYILFFLFLIFFGLYLMVKKRFYKIQIDLKLLGFLLMLVSFSIGASFQESLTFQNFYSEFAHNMSSITSSQFEISSLGQVPLVGGGIIGYAFTALLNNSVTPLGTKIVVIFLLIVGFLLLFKGAISFIFKHIVSFHKKRKNMRAIANEIDKLKDDSKENLEKEVEKEVEKEEKTSEIENNDYKLSREEVNTPSKMMIEEIEEEQIITKKDLSSNNLKEETQLKIKSFFDDGEDIKEETNEIIKPIATNSSPLFDDNEVINKEVNKVKIPYMCPPISLLSDFNDGDKTALNVAVADEYVAKINELFADFKIGAQVISYTIGPSVTRFDVKTNPGVKLSLIAGIQNELAAKLDGNKTVRVELIVEGKDTSGIEVGNKYPSSVSFKDVMRDLSSSPKEKLLITLGKDTSNNFVKTNLDELPHLLVAGTTGSGKSVFIHSIIMTLLMRNTPDDLRFLLIDPKKIEFSKYHDLPHLLCPVIKDAMEATVALKRLVDEMERRYEVFETKANGVSKYSEYMEYASSHNLEKMPVIVVIIDEFADLILQAQKDVETAIQRIGQKARACGIYLILATQRPSVQFVTGDIKGNIPSRIALSVASMMDSRVIIDEPGAETLLGKGDLLAKVQTSKALIRAQSPFAQNKDIIAVCDYIRAHGEVKYYPPFLDLKEHTLSSFEGSAISSSRRTELDPIHEEVKQFVLETKIASTSKIQNTFQVGFSRADYILDCLEREGIVKRLANGRRVVIGDNNEE